MLVRHTTPPKRDLVVCPIPQDNHKCPVVVDVPFVVVHIRSVPCPVAGVQILPTLDGSSCQVSDAVHSHAVTLSCSVLSVQILFGDTLTL